MDALHLRGKPRGFYVPIKFEKPNHLFSVPFTTRRSYKGAVILAPDKAEHNPLDLPPHELRNLVKGTTWRDAHFNAIAERNEFSKQHVHQLILKPMQAA